MNTETKKPKTGTTIYLSDEAVNALTEVKIKMGNLEITRNSDKILYLVGLYKESLEK